MRIYSLKFEGAKVTFNFSHLHCNQVVIFLLAKLCLATLILVSVLSQNARGIRTLEKRKAIFSLLLNSVTDICFLQESYSTQEVENIWRKQWKGNMFFSHGSSHSRGVLVLVRDNLDFQLRSIKVDSQGRYVFLEVSIQDSPYFLLNIYAPNKCSEQCTFWKKYQKFWKLLEQNRNTQLSSEVISTSYLTLA